VVRGHLRLLGPRGSVAFEDVSCACANEDSEVDKTGLNEDSKADANEDGKAVANEDGKAVANEDSKAVANEDDKTVSNEDGKAVANEDSKAVANEDDKTVSNEDGKALIGVNDTFNSDMVQIALHKLQIRVDTLDKAYDKLIDRIQEWGNKNRKKKKYKVLKV